MSRTLISRSLDLQRLEREGYELEIVSGHLVLHNIPYVDTKGKIRRGKLVSTLELSGDQTLPPGTHVCMFAGEIPCDRKGKKLRHLDHGSGMQQIGGITINWSFSCKPKPSGKYPDYYEKMTTYAAMISGHAEELDPSVTARTFQVIESGEDDSPFNYIDNASGKAGITEPSDNSTVWRWDSDAFGIGAPDQDPDGNSLQVIYNLRFPGQVYDAVTGLNYNYYRDYDPATGRYVESDPIGLAGGVNTYGYARGNAISHVDPFGLIDLKIPGATGELSVHANPGPEAVPFPGPGSRIEHDPPHIHLGNNDGPRLRTDTWEPFSADDASRMTKKQKKFCKGLSDSAKAVIRERQKSVFKYGKAMAKLLALPSVGLDSLTSACKQDPFWCAENMSHVFDEVLEK